MAAASFADFAAVLLLSVLFSADGGSGGGRIALFLLFAALVAAVAFAVSATGRRMRVSDVIIRLQDTTAEIRVRAAVLLMVALAVLAEQIGLESILGAFLAGAAVAAIDGTPRPTPISGPSSTRSATDSWCRCSSSAAVCSSTCRAWSSRPAELLRLPVYVAALLVVRGVPAVLFLRRLGRSATTAAALLQATSLPFIVAATQIGVITGRIPTSTATALICAGLVSVMVFPALAVLAARKRSRRRIGLKRSTGLDTPVAARS